VGKTNSSPNFIVEVSEMIHNKVNYLLSRFATTEWSGPAWYQVLKTKDNGFPEVVSLVYFKPIHLGHGTETELDGDKMGKLLPKVYKKFPDLKDCYLGLIHSHHNMGAFLSATDKDTAREQATNDGFFFSTVVASNRDPYDCCFTYLDRFGYSNLIEGKVDVQQPAMVVPKEWKYEATSIEKAKKKENRVTYIGGNGQLSAFGGTRGYVHGGYSGYGGYGYGSVITGVDDKNDKDKEKDEKKQLSSWDRQTEISEEELKKMEELADKFNDGEMHYHDFIEEARKECPNIDPYLYMDSMGNKDDYMW